MPELTSATTSRSPRWCSTANFTLKPTELHKSYHLLCQILAVRDVGSNAYWILHSPIMPKWRMTFIAQVRSILYSLSSSVWDGATCSLFGQSAIEKQGFERFSSKSYIPQPIPQCEFQAGPHSPCCTQSRSYRTHREPLRTQPGSGTSHICCMAAGQIQIGEQRNSQLFKNMKFWLSSWCSSWTPT